MVNLPADEWCGLTWLGTGDTVVGARDRYGGELPNKQDSGSGFDDEHLRAFGDLLRHTEEARIAAGRLRRSVVSTTPRIRGIASSLRSLPTFSVQLSDSAPGRKIEAALS